MFLVGCFSPKTKKGFQDAGTGSTNRGVNVAFKELVHKIMSRIKNEPFFRWPNKMGGPITEESKFVLHISQG